LIYVIDDDRSVRGAITRLLKSAGFSARAFASGREFLKNERPTENDCIILDVHMPGMTGLEVQQALRDNDVRAPIIFITGRSDDTARTAARNTGAVGFFQKPFDDQAMIDTINFALNNR
jgi:FixJ family two-component response regulator